MTRKALTWLANVAIALLFLVVYISEPALAQQRCGPYVEMVERLGNVWSEVLVFKARAPQGWMEIFVNPETQTWTSIHIEDAGNGWSCLRASGTGYVLMQPEAMVLPTPPGATL